MAVTRVKEIAGSRSGRVTPEFEREYRSTWEVLTSDPTDDARVVLGATGLPLMYLSAFPTDPEAVCQGLDPQQTDRDAPCVWTVGVFYTTKSLDPAQQASDGGGSNPNTATESPLNKPPKVRWFKWTEAAPFVETEDVPAVPVQNSAKQPFDPPLETQRHGLAFTITLNRATFSRNDADLYIDSVNSDTFQGFGSGRVRCEDIVGEDDYARGVRYWIVTYTFWVRTPDWDVKVMDAGSVKRTNNGMNYITEKITDRAGNPLGVVKLDGAGQPLADGATTVYLTFRKHVRRPFADLNLPTI